MPTRVGECIQERRALCFPGKAARSITGRYQDLGTAEEYGAERDNNMSHKKVGQVGVMEKQIRRKKVLS